MPAKLLSSVAAILLLSTGPALAQEADKTVINSIADAIMNGEATLDLRYRYENS